MDNKNKKDENDSKSVEKIDYTIRTMSSDLKNDNFGKSSFDLSEEIKQKEDIKEKETPKEPTKNEAKKNEERVNPFLKDLNPERKNIYAETTPNKPKKSIEPKKAPLTPPSKPASPIMEKASENKSGMNSKLLLVLFFVSLTAVLAGSYYYYSTSQNKISVTEEPKSPEILPPIEVSTETSEIEEILLPSALQQKQLIVLEEGSDILTDLMAKKQTYSINKNNYYQIENQGLIMPATSLLNTLGIQLPEELTNELANGWLLVSIEDDALRVNLALEITGNTAVVKASMENNESLLPELLKPLFIDEEIVLQDEEISFQNSGLAQGIRFYNFTKEDFTKSIDWGITNNNYLILATSRDSALELTETLGNKEILPENTETNQENNY